MAKKGNGPWELHLQPRDRIAAVAAVLSVSGRVHAGVPCTAGALPPHPVLHVVVKAGVAEELRRCTGVGAVESRGLGYRRWAVHGFGACALLLRTLWDDLASPLRREIPGDLLIGVLLPLTCPVPGCPLPAHGRAGLCEWHRALARAGGLSVPRHPGPGCRICHRPTDGPDHGSGTVCGPCVAWLDRQRWRILWHRDYRPGGHTSAQLLALARSLPPLAPIGTRACRRAAVHADGTAPGHPDRLLGGHPGGTP